MSWFAAALALAAFAAALVGTRLALWFLERRAILDHPIDRSSHSLPKPRGAGLAVLPVVLVAWVAIGAKEGGNTIELMAICACALVLGVLSWIDDLRGLPVQWRLVGQVAVVAVALTTMAGRGAYFAGVLPPLADTLLAAAVWVWFINLFNFMDGIDGMAGVETASLGFGTAVVAGVVGLGGPATGQGLIIAATALGFLWWNWQPARIFLGDVGSVPLGFLLGWLLLGLAADGAWAAALILPAYYLADATITLIRRALRRTPVWRAHREHFYQRAVQRGRSHAAVAGAVLVANLLLVALAGLAAAQWWRSALLGAGVVVAALIAHLGWGGVKATDEPPVAPL